MNQLLHVDLHFVMITNHDSHATLRSVLYFKERGGQRRLEIVHVLEIFVAIVISGASAKYLQLSK